MKYRVGQKVSLPHVSSQDCSPGIRKILVDNGYKDTPDVEIKPAQIFTVAKVDIKSPYSRQEDLVILTSPDLDIVAGPEALKLAGCIICGEEIINKMYKCCKHCQIIPIAPIIEMVIYDKDSCETTDSINHKYKTYTQDNWMTHPDIIKRLKEVNYCPQIQKVKSEWNSKCWHCGADAYAGIFSQVCSKNCQGR